MVNSGSRIICPGTMIAARKSSKNPAPPAEDHYFEGEPRRRAQHDDEKQRRHDGQGTVFRESPNVAGGERAVIVVEVPVFGQRPDRVVEELELRLERSLQQPQQRVHHDDDEQDRNRYAG